MLYDTIIIGGGTAGLTAALYVKREGKSVMLLEREGFGGQILYAPKVENYPGYLSVSGADLIDKLLTQVEAIGTDYSLEAVLRVAGKAGDFEVTTDSGVYHAKTVIIATGLVRKKLGLSNEEKLIGRGVSYCATCDGAFFRDKTATVVGGGNTALSDVLHLSAYCATVNLVHRRQTFRAEHALVERVKDLKNVRLYLDATITGLIENEQGLSAVTLESPAGSGAPTTLNTDGLFVSVGKVPQNDVFSGLLQLDGAGYIAAGEDTVTTCPGIFAAGDCRTKRVRQLTTAAADGTVAALAVIDRLA